MSAQQTGDGIQTVTLTTPAQYEQAAELYRMVFGYQHPDYGVNPRLLRSLVANGGSVVGAVDDAGRMIGFAYGFCGTDGHGFYHYSQSAVVADEVQGRGLGRRLKQAQREVALSNGTTRMRWSYDPLQTRNAHFNLDVLGARGRWFHPDFFGEPGTDRVVVEWDLLRDEPARQPVPDHPELGEADWGLATGSWLALPADFAALARTRPELAEQVRLAVGTSFADLLAKDLVAESCRRLSEHTAAYRFGPMEEPGRAQG